MSLNAVKMLEINISFISLKNILESLNKYLNFRSKKTGNSPINDIKPLVIYTPNPEQVVYAYHNNWFRKLLNQADIAIPDGIGLIMAAKLLGLNSKNFNLTRISGVDFIDNFLEAFEKNSVTIGLIGGYGSVAVNALECLRDKYPNVRGWSMDAPEIIEHSGELCIMNHEPLRFHSGQARIMNQEAIKKEKSIIHNSKFLIHAPKSLETILDQMINQIKKNRTRIVFVGLGAPKQEILIDLLRKILIKDGYKYPVVLMSVGGAFDMISGQIMRAPKLMRNLGFEWLWRLVIEPKRWKRQLKLIEFMYLVGIEKIKLLIR